MKPLHIGIDFDNTIVCYDDVFFRAALEKKLIPDTLSQSKTQIRDYFRAQQREDEWTELQGYVYGARMDLARPFPGVEPFFHSCRKEGIKLSIISHKTRHPYLGPKYDLHAAAKKWLEKQPFFHSEITPFFELTLPEKLERIEKEQCDFFIDDLPELLNEAQFPAKVAKILFDPANLNPTNPKWLKITSWNQMLSILPQLSPS